LADGMDVGEGVVVRQAREEEMKELAVIGRELDGFVGVEILLADGQVEDALAALDFDYASQIRPAAFDERGAKIFFFGAPPHLSPDGGKNETHSGNSGGPPTAAILRRAGSGAGNKRGIGGGSDDGDAAKNEQQPENRQQGAEVFGQRQLAR